MELNKKPLWMQIVVLAMPLILSMAGVMVMQFVDALFLSWYSFEAIGAIVPASMGSYLIISPFQATAGYTSTLVAHYVGARNDHRAYAATWQGIYCAIFSGIIIAVVGFFAQPIFDFVGHDKNVQPLESIYFAISCWGAFPVVMASAISGFFTGRGKTGTVMVIQLSGILLNALLAYVLIFGKFGFPQWGMAGAAIATVSSQLFIALLLLGAFLMTKTTVSVNAWADRFFNPALFMRLIRFGFPSGLRYGFEMLAWTVFIFIVGRVGVNELAASNIAFRLNGFSFFPVIGVGQAVAILVGQAQGRLDSARSVRVTYTGFIVSELWMITAALIFVFFPTELYGFFSGDGYGDFDKIAKVGATLLQLMAVYCLMDAGNIIFVSALQAAGDTRWTMFFALVANGIFLAALVFADINKMGLWVEWCIATVFVMVVAMLWFFRFRGGKWRTIQVIEQPAEVSE